MRIAVIGLGSIGRRHAKNFHDLGCEVTKYDPLYGHKLSVEAALEGADGCVIATPPASHIEIAWKALGAGSHLMIEKPVSTDLTDLGHLFAACEQKGRTHMVAYPWRYDVGMRLKRDELSHLQVKQINTMYGYYAQNKTATDMGALLDCSHAIDYLRWCFGEIAQLRCDLSAYETEAWLDMVFESGARGAAHLFINGTMRCEWDATGPNGKVGWLRFRDSQDTDAMYVAEARRFLDCIEGKAKPETDGWDARNTLRVALAARQSAQEGRWIAR